MLKTLTKREIVRTSTNKSDKNISGCVYSNCYTLEPLMVLDAWDTLTEDTFAIEIASYPKIFHNGLRLEMKKRAKHA